MKPADLYFLSRKLKAVAERAQRTRSQLPMAQALVLEEAAHKPGVSVGEIAHTHGMAQSLVSGAVQELVEKGLLVASPDQKDRRKTSLTITIAGEKHVSSDAVDALLGALDKLNARDQKSARAGLDLLLRALGR
jgi:DNA-binding MarR family transcriptional regulator